MRIYRRTAQGLVGQVQDVQTDTQRAFRSLAGLFRPGRPAVQRRPERRIQGEKTMTSRFDRRILIRVAVAPLLLGGTGYYAYARIGGSDGSKAASG